VRAGDAELLEALVGRRLTGEPLAWITGTVSFCSSEIGVDPGVYVPRWQSEPLALRAVERLPANGVAIDLCTGTGAMAKTLATSRPGARVVASDVDERAVACAAANGVEVYCGDLFTPLPRTLEGAQMSSSAWFPMCRHPRWHCSRRHLRVRVAAVLRRGREGTEILRRVLAECPASSGAAGALLLELGGEQADALGDDLDRLGYVDVVVLFDQDGDVRGVEVTLGQRR